MISPPRGPSTTPLYLRSFGVDVCPESTLHSPSRTSSFNQVMTPLYSGWVVAFVVIDRLVLGKRAQNAS